ncbi:MAG: rRNA maturation RNase YbeY [Anaerolineae bacterium]|nr:rRNA maturation RNase YbeY [Anaerolineae bacterium]
MVHVTVRAQYKKILKPAFVSDIADRVLKYLDIPTESELSIIIDNDDFIRELNQKYRDQNEPTDVLSFSSNETDPQTGLRYYGDIIISYPRAVTQAQTGGHKVEDEITLLIVHGILHLLGYDHEVETDQEKMWAVQNKILFNLGCNVKI